MSIINGYMGINIYSDANRPPPLPPVVTTPSEPDSFSPDQYPTDNTYVYITHCDGCENCSDTWLE